jgi:hypothetical protein
MEFGSKSEIYEYYDLAIKLIVDGMLRQDYYARVLDAIKWDDRRKVEKLMSLVQGFSNEGSSTGFVVELPATDDRGGLLGTKFVLLEHESGPELFVKVLSSNDVITGILATLIFVRTKLVDALYDQLQTYVLEKIGKRIRESWVLIKGGTGITAVELRTANRGIVRVSFSEFDPDGLSCLLDRMVERPDDRLISFNQPCFGGSLVEIE